MLAPRFGQFSHLWIDLAQRVGLDVVVQDEEWGTGASPERIEDALTGRPRAHDQRRACRPQRDRHRCHKRRCCDTARDRCCRASGDALRRRRQLDCQHRFPHGRLGCRSRCHRIAERADASQPVSASFAPVRRRWRRNKNARCTRTFFRLRRPDESKRDGVFSLYAVAANALWAEGVPQHPVRGAASTACSNGTRSWPTACGQR